MHYNEMSFGNYEDYIKQAGKQDREKRQGQYYADMLEIDRILLEDQFKLIIKEDK